MKINIKDLETPSDVSTENKIDIKENEKRTTLRRRDGPDGYAPEVLEFIGRSGFRIASSIKQALIDRASKRKTLTIREADILCRQGIDVSSDLLQEALMMEGFSVIEPCSEGCGDDSIFGLRDSYNKGIAWRDGKRKTSSEIDKKKGDARIFAITEKMKEMQLPPFPLEIKNGFHVDLLKPEWMNWDQWTRYKKSPHKITDPTPIEDSNEKNSNSIGSTSG